MNCTRLTIWTLCAIGLQIAGLALFVLGFFPVKPTLSGFSGPESYRPPWMDSVEDYNVTAMSYNELRSLYLELSQMPSIYDRLIFMVIDGLPAEFVLGKNGELPPKVLIDAMPYTQSLLANGMAIGYHALAAPPTVTMPRLKAMVSGAVGGFLDIAFNFNTQVLLDDNLLAQLFRIGWKMVMLGDETWLKLFPQMFMRRDGVSSFFVKDTVQVDHNVSRHLPEELGRDDWQLLVLHYLGLDHVGHIGGRKSILMAPKLREMDDVIRTIHVNNIVPYNKNKGRTLLVVVSDHGMTESGNHGGSSYEETDSLALFIGPGTRTSGDASASHDTVNQVDIAPTLALLFGVPIPKNNVGVVIPECLHSLRADQKLRVLGLNAWQLLRLLRAELPGLSCLDSSSDWHASDRWSRTSTCDGTQEEKFCCLYSKAAVLHSTQKSTNFSSSSGMHQYTDTVAAYYNFLTAASGWLARRITDKPVGQLATGIVAMSLSCLVLLKLLFCLRREEYHNESQGSMHKSNIIPTWSSEEVFIEVVVVIVIISMTSSSLVEEEQYIWHFLTSTMCWILFRKTMQSSHLSWQFSLSKRQHKQMYQKISSIIVLLVTGRILRGWHQGGVNWTHLPDISKWLEEHSTSCIKPIGLVSGILVMSLSLFVFSKPRSNGKLMFLVRFIFLVSGLLVLQHISKYQFNPMMASSYGATLTAQVIYAVLGISTFCTVLASPWLSCLISEDHPCCNNWNSGSYSKGETRWLLGIVIESSYLSGWAYISSWCLLQLLLQQPINSMPVFLLLVQICSCVLYFQNDGPSRKHWVEAATLYFLGMAGHFGLGNTNTLATIDIAGAFIGISSHSTLLSGVLMFCITYASPMLVLLSLVMYVSTRDMKSPISQDNDDFGQLLKTVVAIPCLVPLCMNSLLLTSYTVVLLLMRNHLFIWSVFSPKYMYVGATTMCVYIGLFIVVITEIYICSVCAWRKRACLGLSDTTQKSETMQTRSR